MNRWFAAAALGAAWFMEFAPQAYAQTATPPVTIEVVPVFGEGCVPRSGLTEFVVTIQNGANSRISGSARIVSGVSGNIASAAPTEPVVPFNLPARGRATVRVPAPVRGLLGQTAVLRVDDTQGHVLGMQPLRLENPVDAFFVDATPQGRLALAMRAANTPDPFAPPSAGAPRPSAGMTPCPAARIDATGDVVLPRSQVGYTGVSLVLIDSGTLMSLPLAERVTLADWVLSGGSLALIPSRPDELRHPTLEAFVGPGAHGSTPVPINMQDPTWLALSNTAPPGTVPLPATLEHAESFEGGHLHTRALGALFPWGSSNLLGATADYGFGRVHVLSFNPAAAPALSDPWSQQFVSLLARQSGTSVVQHPVGDQVSAPVIPSAVRRMLDPNEGFRSGLGIAVLLLVLYAIFAGPFSFRRAARQGHPLRALARLPIYSVVIFAAIVVLGGLSRGFQGRARRLTMIELPAGMSRGAMRRYHGYFSGNAGTLSIRAAGVDRRLYSDPAEGNATVTLALARDGATLQGLVITPWSTSVVREQGYETTPGSVTLQPDFAGQVRIVNHMAYALRNVIVVAPAQAQAWAIREIRSGQTTLATTGTPVPAPTLAALTLGVGAAVYTAPGLTGYPAPGTTTDSATIGAQLASLFGGDTRTASDWNAVFESASNFGVASTDGPALIAQLDMPRPSADDGGLNVEREFVAIRVVGWGGAP